MYLFVDQLTNVDFSYLCSKRGLVGETWLANFGLEGALDEQGMICDFGLVKRQFRQWLDNHLDHCLAVPVASENLSFKQNNDQISLTWRYDAGEISLDCPRQAVALVPVNVIEPANTAQWVIQQSQKLMPEQVESIDLDFTTEAIDGPFYHYTHGLKKHQGNCQRIAHGHRSRIAIWLDGTRQPVLEKQWAKLWRDIYLGTRADISSQTPENTEFFYQAAQGDFRLSLPTDSVYLIDEETTVEYIAQHMAQQIKSQFPERDVKVKAYEGLGKGAIAKA